jgi:hypothetical protein
MEPIIKTTQSVNDKESFIYQELDDLNLSTIKADEQIEPNPQPQ